MSNVLVFVEQTGGKIKKGSLPGITFGKELAQKSGGELHLLVIGSDVSAAAKEAAAYGPAKVHLVDNAAFANYLAESYTDAVVAAIKAANATLVAGATSTTTKDLLPRVAGRIDAAMASDVLEIVGADTFKRPMWAGNVVATVQLTTPVKVVTVRGTEFGAPEQGASPADVSALNVQVNIDTLGARFVSFQEVKSERPDVTTADIVVSGGRGVKGPEGFKLIEQLADLLNAGLGASRAVCDAGWVPNDLQIGQTGKVVAPNLYFAIGISGAIQHLAGMKGSKTIVAINKDPEAPIFQVADYGLVADLFQAVPEIIEQVKKLHA